MFATRVPATSADSESRRTRKESKYAAATFSFQTYITCGFTRRIGLLRRDLLLLSDFVRDSTNMTFRSHVTASSTVPPSTCAATPIMSFQLRSLLTDTSAVRTAQAVRSISCRRTRRLISAMAALTLSESAGTRMSSGTVCSRTKQAITS